MRLIGGNPSTKHIFTQLPPPPSTNDIHYRRIFTAKKWERLCAGCEGQRWASIGAVAPLYSPLFLSQLSQSMRRQKFQKRHIWQQAVFATKQRTSAQKLRASLVASSEIVMLIVVGRSTRVCYYASKFHDGMVCLFIFYGRCMVMPLIYMCRRVMTLGYMRSFMAKEGVMMRCPALFEEFSLKQCLDNWCLWFMLMKTALMVCRIFD